MYISVISWWFGVLFSSLFALVGWFIVTLATQDLAVGIVAGIAGLTVGLVVGFVIAAWLERDEQSGPEFATGDENEWPPLMTNLFALIVFFGGPVAAIVVTLVVGWLLSG